MGATPMHREMGGRQVRGAGPLVLTAFLLIGALLAACTDNKGPSGPTFPAKVVGDAIGGPGGTINIQAIVTPGVVDRGRRASVEIFVTSANGAPLPNRRVSVSSAGGSFDQASGTTDGEGSFRTTIFVPCTVAAGPYAITAVVEGKSVVLEGAFTAATAQSNDPCAGVVPVPPAAPGAPAAPTLPTVSITSSGTADDGLGTTATFTVTRTGSTGSALSVVLVATGSATFGADYGLVGGAIVGTTVTIPAGSSSANFTLNPVIGDGAEADDPSGPNLDAELAILTISPAATYTVGAPSSAQVEIVDGG